MRILFMGTPDFATISLKALLAEPDFSVVGVLTQIGRASCRERVCLSV